MSKEEEYDRETEIRPPAHEKLIPKGEEGG
jgi:hypothetical protein